MKNATSSRTGENSSLLLSGIFVDELKRKCHTRGEQSPNTWGIALGACSDSFRSKP
jgi:hypothetical protein